MEWVLNGLNFSESSGMDIMIDDKSNVFIVAHAYNDSKQAYDILLIKYNNSGSIKWQRIWGGDYDDYGNTISIDNSGNVYVAGGTNSYGNGSSDITLIKYDNTGELVWNKTWGGSLWDSSFGLTFDESNNIYVIGYTESYDLYGDIVLLKFSNTGSLLLNRTFGGIDTECAYDIKCDLNGSIYFTGYTSSFGANLSDFLLIKCNYNGDQLWNITSGGVYPTIGTSLTIDSQSNVIVVANTQDQGTVYNFNVSKINSLGEYIWNYTFSASEYDLGYDVYLDSRQNIFITGHSNEDALLLKLNQSGGKKWVKHWDGNLTDYAFGISIDNSDNTFITGKTKSSDHKYKLFLMKFLPIPDEFELISDAENPDSDGNFSLTWFESLDADNYSLYQSSYLYIGEEYWTEEEEKLLVNETVNRTYSLENLFEGIYSFKVIAHNIYGNTSSNSLEIKVQFPPSEFKLNNIIKTPIKDGIVNLTWTESNGAKNYSVYVHDSVIAEISEGSSLVEEGIITTSFLIENLTNGDYYYAIAAVNEAGVRISNTICVIVRRAPAYFELTTDANNPDEDGNFELIWTRSEYALNYTIYFTNQSSLDISYQVLYDFTPPFEWSIYRYQIEGWANGTYEFQVIAYNEFGEFQTEWLEIKISIPNDNLSPNDRLEIPEEIIQRIILYLILAGALGGLIVLYVKFKK
ncbi:MAG: SBBP repeat-containing protein [Promethearchaeota archaeon]